MVVCVVLRIIHLDVHVFGNIIDAGIVSIRSKYKAKQKFNI